jgi:hypothetical protein
MKALDRTDFAVARLVFYAAYHLSILPLGLQEATAEPGVCS